MSESPFFEGTQLQFAWDSTSLGLLMDCPRKYFYTMIEGWRGKSESVHLKFGSIFASAMEVYHGYKTATGDHEEALDAVVAYVLEATWDRETNTPWSPDNSPKKNRDTLLRTVIWYFEEYRDDPASIIILPDGKPATELSFKFESGLKDPFGGEYLLCGHLDRVVSYAGDTFVMDQKTTGGSLGSFYFSQFDLSTQMSQYTLAGQVVYNMPIKGVIIDAAAILVGSTSFGRAFTMRTPSQLKEWLANTGEQIALAERFADRGHWPMNLSSCEKYGGCVFKPICRQDPGQRQTYLETGFEKRFWNPLEVR